MLSNDLVEFNQHVSKYVVIGGVATCFANFLHLLYSSDSFYKVLPPITTFCMNDANAMNMNANPDIDGGRYSVGKEARPDTGGGPPTRQGFSWDTLYDYRVNDPSGVTTRSYVDPITGLPRNCKPYTTNLANALEHLYKSENRGLKKSPLDFSMFEEKDKRFIIDYFRFNHPGRNVNNWWNSRALIKALREHR